MRWIREQPHLCLPHLTAKLILCLLGRIRVAIENEIRKRIRRIGTTVKKSVMTTWVSCECVTCVDWSEQDGQNFSRQGIL